MRIRCDNLKTGVVSHPREGEIILLNFPVTKNEDAGPLKMSSGKTIFCYQIIPLYPDELKFKMDNGADALFDKFQEKGIDATLVNNDRPSAM